MNTPAVKLLEERRRQRMLREPIRIVYSDDRIQQVLYPDGLLLQTNVQREENQIVILFKRKTP